MKYELVIGVQNAPDFYMEFDNKEELKAQENRIDNDIRNGKGIYLTNAKSRLQSTFSQVKIPQRHVTFIGIKEKKEL
jgi:hypothetical protein